MLSCYGTSSDIASDSTLLWRVLHLYCASLSRGISSMFISDNNFLESEPVTYPNERWFEHDCRLVRRGFLKTSFLSWSATQLDTDRIAFTSWLNIHTFDRKNDIASPCDRRKYSFLLWATFLRSNPENSRDSMYVSKKNFTINSISKLIVTNYYINFLWWKRLSVYIHVYISSSRVTS